jgi:hypothetical protein
MCASDANEAIFQRKLDSHLQVLPPRLRLQPVVQLSLTSFFYLRVCSKSSNLVTNSTYSRHYT